MDYGYMVELADVPSTIHALTVGKFEHPIYGEIDITPDRIGKFAASINDKVRGIDADIDYEHKARDGKAAGWVKSAEAKDDGLWLTIDWTEPARKEIEAKEWRYFSPEFTDEWTAPDGTKHEDVILGGGLTNRPFLKDLMPLNFDELYELRDISTAERKAGSASDFAGKNRSFPIFKAADVSAAVSSMGRAGADNYDTATLKSNIIRIAKRKGFTSSLPKSWQMIEGGETLDPKKLAEILGIEEDDEDKLLSQVKNLFEFHAKQTADVDKAKKFAEDYPEEAKRLAEQQKTLDEVTRTNKLMETDNRIDEWHKAGLPPVVDDQVRDFRMGLDGDTATKFDEIVANVTKTGLVKFGEHGGTIDPSTVGAETQFEGAIKKLMEEDKDLKYKDAAIKVARQNPELKKDYDASLRG